MSIAERLKVVRGRESRESFAPKIGVHPQTLYRYEQGGRDIDSAVVVAVCKGFDILPAWLLFGEGPMHAGDAPLAMPAHQVPTCPPEPHSCDRCARLEAKLEAAEQERRELIRKNGVLIDELREVNAENRQMAREIKILSVDNCVLREQNKKLVAQSVVADCP